MNSRALLTRCVKNFANCTIDGHSQCFSTSNMHCKPEYVSEADAVHKTELKILEQDAKYSQIEVKEVEDVGLASSVPEEHIKTRRVRIYQPPKNAMQSGRNNVNFWQIDFDTRERWENPLMGWCSTGDPMSNIKVDFTSINEAVQHCKKMGWDYYIQKPNVVGPKPRSYGQNFSWDKRTRVSTK